MFRGLPLKEKIEQQIEEKKTWSPYHPYEVSSLFCFSVYFYAYETDLTSLGYLNRIKAPTNLDSLSPSPAGFLSKAVAKYPLFLKNLTRARNI